jgi:hypothetical protein
MLAGAPSPSQASTLVANIRRFLDGVGAPAAIHGPARIGSTLVPAANDPAVTEHSSHSGGVQNNADYQAGVWFAVNGWTTCGLSSLDGEVPHAADYAWSEFIRNTLATHAAVYPNAWDGILSVDDMCWGFYSEHPERCGNGLSTTYDTQIMHEPAWSLWDAINLAGIEPEADGYRIDPHPPMRYFSLRLPLAGVSYEPSRVRGYFRPEAAANVLVHVKVPTGVNPARVITWVAGQRVAHTTSDGVVTFPAELAAHSATDWALTWKTGAARAC